MSMDDLDKARLLYVWRTIEKAEGAQRDLMQAYVFMTDDPSSLGHTPAQAKKFLSVVENAVDVDMLRSGVLSEAERERAMSDLLDKIIDTGLEEAIRLGSMGGFRNAQQRDAVLSVWGNDPSLRDKPPRFTVKAVLAASAITVQSDYVTKLKKKERRKNPDGSV